MCKKIGQTYAPQSEMVMIFDSFSENESFARMVIAAFIACLDPTLEELSDIKTAVSEAVSNCVIHAYEDCVGKIQLHCVREEQNIMIEITDYGKGIDNIKEAMTPAFTSKMDQERAGMGFMFMESFMDSLSVISTPGIGTRIVMEKMIGQIEDIKSQGA